MSTIAEALRRATDHLNSSGSDAPSLEARILLEKVLGCSRVWLYQNAQTQFDDDKSQQLQRLVDRRVGGEPLAYLIGTREFYGRPFVVDNRVLIPRPETETLLERALDFARRHSNPTIVDVGTGSGILAISLALEIPSAKVLAIDLSEDALAVARMNCLAHRVDGRVELIQGDLLDGLGVSPDLIVANLPYVASGDIDHLQTEVQREPRSALDGGPDGLDLYRRLFTQASEVLPSTGALFVEIGDTQGALAAALAQKHFPSHQIQLIQDLAGRDRVIAVVPGH